MSEKLVNSEEKMEQIKQRQQGNGVTEATAPICPFMSTPDKEVSCTPRCKLFRKARQGYECYIMEMQSISWNTRKSQGPPQY